MYRSPNSVENLSSEEIFATHEQLARRFMWHEKLFRASRVALLVAVLGLVLYILFAHRVLLQFSPLAFLLALLIPNGNGQERALEHIDADIGLSYRTALEYEESQNNKSEIGPIDFSSMLLKRAAYRIRNLEVPDLQPWWLPMLATSIVLSLVPLFLNATPLNFGGRGLLGNSNFQSPFNQPPPNQEPLPEEEAATEQDSVEEEAAEDASDLAAQDQDDADLESSFEDSSEQPDRNVSEAEGETLSRFLDNLKEKPQPEEEVAGQENQNRQRSQDGSSDSENSEETEQRRSGEEANTENSESEESSESAAEQGSGENEEGQEQAASESEEGQEQAEDATASESGENDGEEGAQEGAQPQVGGRQEGEEDTSFGSEDNENGIGSGASEATPNSGERLEGQMQAPELLEGQILSDDSTIAGEVRLPGSDQGDIPDGSSAQDFDRAVERAIAEGRIPVEYQEILKNYFR